MSILLFEDSATDQLDPIAVAQPAFAVSCGGQTLADVVAQLELPARHLVRPHLVGIQQEDFPDAPVRIADAHRPLLVINARLIPSEATRRELASLWIAAAPGIVRIGDQVAAALVAPAARSAPLAAADAEALLRCLDTLKLPPLAAELKLMQHPHNVLREHLASLASNLAARIARGGYQQTADGVFLGPGAELGSHVVTDMRHGPIVLEANAQVGPFSYLQGPIHLGVGAKVAEHASVKHNVAMGHTTKLGGEVTDSIIEPYSNKQHHGFIGHSYLGRWVNLGAGTCTSNLKNTYGAINMEYGGRKVATGMQFLGCIVGDYAKAAINTGIFTGKTVGACSMLYGFVTTNVPAFVNYARSFGQISEVPVEVMIATQARMFARRNVEQRPCDIELLEAIFRLTAPQRAAGGQRMSDEPLLL